MSEKAERIAPYTALVVQPEVTVVKKREDIRKNLGPGVQPDPLRCGLFLGTAGAPGGVA